MYVYMYTYVYGICICIYAYEVTVALKLLPAAFTICAAGQLYKYGRGLQITINKGIK